MDQKGATRRRLVLLWLGTTTMEVFLTLYTFKMRLIPVGMDSRRAYILGVGWETLHLLLVVFVLPAVLLRGVWRSLGSMPVHRWKRSELTLAWLIAPTVWLFGMMSESVLADTVLPIYEPPLVTALHVTYGLIIAIIFATTLRWLMSRSTPEP